MTIMKRLAVAQAKAHLTTVLREMSKTGESVIVTNRGKAVAKIVPIQDQKTKAQPFFNRLKGIVTIHGEITKPIIPAEDWDNDWSF